MQTLISTVNSLLTRLIAERTKISLLLKIFVGLLLLFWILAIFLIFQNPLLLKLFSPIGNKLGIVAVATYGATLLPGIIKRFQIKDQSLVLLRVLLAAHRQWLGICMFLVVIMHMSLVFTLPQLIATDFNTALITFLPIHITGIIALWLLFPLWLTSNNLSIKKLGVWWNRLHKLTYVALFFIFVHVAIVEFFPIGLGLGILLGLELVSWIRVWRNHKV